MPLVLIEHVPGAVIDTEGVAATIPPHIRRTIGLSLASTLARVHDVDLRAAGLVDLASHAPYAPRQVKRWHQQWEATCTHDAPLVHELAERFVRGAPVQRELSLVHGDYHLLNAIVDPDDGTVCAILDWELSTLGEPLADLGTLLAYWPEADDNPIAGLIRLNLLPGFPSRDELVSAYVAASGRDVETVEFWHALGYWKIAIIAAGVRRRRLEEPQNGTPVVIDVIDHLLERARQTADVAGI